LRIDHLQAVAITVKSDAEISSNIDDGSAQCLRTGGAAIAIDVEPIGTLSDRGDRSAKLAEHLWRNLVGRAMCAIDDKMDTMQVE
jgi:hypothetical protein